MLNDIKSNMADAHDRTLQAGQALQFITEFLWHVAEDIENLARGEAEVSATEVFEFGDRLRFLARLYEKEHWQVYKVADQLEAANAELRPLVLASDVSAPDPATP